METKQHNTIPDGIDTVKNGNLLMSERYIRACLKAESYPISMNIRINNKQEFLAFYELIHNMDTIRMQSIVYNVTPDTRITEYLYNECKGVLPIV